MEYPDYRYSDEREQYEYFKSLDYSKVTDYKVLFSDFNSYMRALVKMDHPFHKEAQKIRENRMMSRKSYTLTDADERWSEGYERHRYQTVTGDYS